MNRWIGIGVAAALTAAVIWGWQGSWTNGGGLAPKMVFEETLHNFGQMDQLKTGAHEFRISNEGTADLVLNFQYTHCGCTRVKLNELVWNPKVEKDPPDGTIQLAPGEKATLQITWDTEQKRGPFRTSIRLGTNDPDHNSVEFYLEGEVIPVVELSRTYIRMTKLRSDVLSSESFEVASQLAEDMELHHKIASNPLVHVTFEPYNQEKLTSMSLKSGYQGTVKIDPGLPIGSFRARVTIGTNLPDRPEFMIQIAGKVKGDVILTPSDQLDFKGIRLGSDEGRSLHVDIKVTRDEPVKVDALHWTPEFLQVSVEPQTGKNRYRLEVFVPLDAPGGNFKGTIELETSYAGAKKILIPVGGRLFR